MSKKPFKTRAKNYGKHFKTEGAVADSIKVAVTHTDKPKEKAKKAGKK